MLCRDRPPPATCFGHLHDCHVDRGKWDSRIRVFERPGERGGGNSIFGCVRR